MIPLNLLIILIIGTFVMFIPIIIQTIWYKIQLWKSAPVAICLTIIGTIGTYLMFFIENRELGGISFFGAVFLVPILFVLISKLLRIPYKQIIDLCAPAECIMLVIMKYQCLNTGCCGGRILFETASGEIIRFPSQMVELINALILCVVLMILSYKPKYRGSIYPWYLVLYGTSRFILNFFRDVWGEGTIPYGTIWSIVSVIIGTIWLIILKKRKECTNEPLDNKT